MKLAKFDTFGFEVVYNQLKSIIYQFKLAL